MNILFVDDEKEFLELMSGRLKKRGFEAATASSGVEALRLLEKYAFDLAVLDVKMPGMDGLELLRRIKTLAPSLPVWLLTGLAGLETAALGMENGAADYLLKPVSINDFIMRISELPAREG